jgi:predicted amidohydrolase YtcJ
MSNKYAEAEIKSNSTIYYGGDIITADDANPGVEAVFVKDGKIVFAGNKETALKLKEQDTREVDLQGKTLLPGFIDGHSHICGVAEQTRAQILNPPPVGTVQSIADVQKELRTYQKERNIAPGKWIFGFGYDDSLLKEKRNPTKADLDLVSTESPILVFHTSGHLAVVNSKALEMLDINAQTKDPEGGIIRRIAGSNEPDGVLEETAVFLLVLPRMPQPTIEEALGALAEAQNAYLSNGYTTVQEGRTMYQYYQMLALAIQKGIFKIDVISYPDYEHVQKIITEEFPAGVYRNHFKFGGIKIVLDGSPQGKTAWLTQPYHIAPEGKDASYNGYPTYTDEKVTDFYKTAILNKWQPLAHANGDATMDQIIRCYEKAVQETGQFYDLRPVVIHAQTAREDQLDSMKKLGMIPSFFNAHVFYWGDYHVNSVLGPERGMRISPIKSAIARGLKFTLHQDSPITPPNAIHSIWSAVNRVSREGKIIGDDQKIPVMEAIKGFTINGAYQYFEENSKGSIAAGKKADLVILDKNPLKVDPLAIKDIKIMETIKDGKTVYALDAAK